MPIYTLNLKTSIRKRKKEKRLSASRVGHKAVKKKRINTCFKKNMVKGAKWLMVYALIFNSSSAQFTGMISGFISIPVLDR